jgi:signal transduction histidine kinase/streptogramin lyase
MLDFLLSSPGGGYWRLANGQIQKWANKQLQQDFGPYPWGKNGHVSCAVEDPAGNLLVGTRGSGVFRFEPGGKITGLSTNEGLSHNYVLSLYPDREGTLWVGTDGGGLNRVKRQLFEPMDATRGLAVQSVCEDTAGTLWIGSNGAGVFAFRQGKLELAGLTNFAIRSILADQEGGIWAGTWGLGLFELRRGSFLTPAGLRTMPPIVQAGLQDREGQIWFGTRGGLIRKDSSGWKQFTTRDGLTSDLVSALASDEEGTLWIGTRGGGLNRLREGKFSAFRQADGGLPGDDISALHSDADGVLWVTTAGNGLGRLHHNGWTRYGTREGLISNNLGYMLEDNQGHLWIGSYSGLMRLPKEALNEFARGATNFIPCRVYGRRDGLPSGECTFGSQPAAIRSRDGRLWFPTIDGVASIDPAKLPRNLYPPPVVIESVLVDGRARNTNALRSGGLSSLTLPAGEQRLEIRYTSLNLAAPERARFRYRLEGHESDWTDAGSARIVRYSRLPPGTYRFRVTACNEDGVWNEEGSSLAILIQPPFWQTGWFLTASAATLLGITVGLVHFFSTQKLQREVQKLKQQEALERERARIARDLHDQLGANLTQVALLGEMAQSDKEIPEEVEAHAQQISSTARETTRALDEIVWAVNPSNDTLDGLVTYACKYAQDYFTLAGLRYRVDVPPQLPPLPIPPDVRHNIFLAFKESVTNVVKHARATEGRVRLRLDSTSFSLEVEDNGQGLPKSEEIAAKMRNGLRNMRKRMEDIGGSLVVDAGPEGGTVVRLTAPLAKSTTL